MDRAQVQATVKAATEQAYLLRVANPQEGLRLAQHARVLAVQSDFTLGEAGALFASGACRVLLAEYEAAFDDLRSAIGLFERLGDEAGRARGLSWIGQVHYHQGEYGRALEAETAALELQRAADDLDQAATLNNIGRIYGDVGDYEGALEAFTRSLQILRHGSDLVGISHCLNNIGAVHGQMGQWRHARRYVRHALSLRKRAGARVRYADTLMNLGICEEKLQNDPAAIQYYRQARTAARRWNPASLPAILQRVAGWQLRTGERSRALKLFAKAVADAGRAGSPYWECLGLLNYGEALLQVGRSADAIPQLRAALAIAERTDAGDNKVLIYEALAAACEAAGDHRAASGYLDSFHAEKARIYGAEVSRRVQVGLFRSEARLTRAELRQLGRAARPERRRSSLLDQQLTSAFVYSSQQDPATGLFNRRHFDAEYPRLFHRARELDCELTLVIADLDDFKRVNDSFGHEVGNQVLGSVAMTLREGSRQADLVARIGGEEMALLLLDTSPREALALCERLRSAVERHDWAAVHPELRVTLSMGLAGSRSADSPRALFVAADARMYEAKRAGRNRVVGGD